MELKEVKDKKLWNDFVSQHGPRSGSFLHSWEWGEFKQVAGEQVFRLGLYQSEPPSSSPLRKGGEIEAVAVLIERKLPHGYKYFFCPRGPVSSPLWHVTDLVKVIAKELSVRRAASGERRAVFIRFEPPIEGKGKLHDRPAVSSASIHPKQTLLLDLSKGADQLLTEMHQKTRYNIRLAEKKGVQIEMLRPEQFDQAWPVFEQTSKRDKFRLHDRKYYEQMLSIGNDTREGVNIRLVVARYQNEIIAATIMIDFAGVRTYLHGASSNKHRNVMAPYLIHWHEIQDAVKQGYRYYDLWGISDTNPEWKGITRFKRGFGGEEVDYAGTYDLVLNKIQYFLYSIARRVLYSSRR